MHEIHQRYIDTFKQVGSPLLSDYGFSFNILSNRDPTRIIISKSRHAEYLLTFSTDRLDWDSGVLICEANDEKLHWDKIRLPNQIRLNKGNIYRFTGIDLESEIRRIIMDFRYYVYSKEHLGGEPFLYCTQDAVEINLSCENTKIKKLSSNLKERARGKEFSYLNTVEEIYQCDECAGYWKRAYNNSGREVWLKIGEVSDQKYFERNLEDFKIKKLNNFPLTFFNVSEAIECGLVLECGRFNRIDNYFGLSCSPKHLSKIKDVSSVETIGNHIKIGIYQCLKCSTYYKIREEYDSHHGFNNTCIRLNEKAEIGNGEIFEFLESDLLNSSGELKIIDSSNSIPDVPDS
jgi:hypothetical protein